MSDYDLSNIVTALCKNALLFSSILVRIIKSSQAVTVLTFTSGNLVKEKKYRENIFYWNTFYCWNS